jgi:lactate permease
MRFTLSLFPILLILYLMVGRRWSAARAGTAGYLAALILAFGFFGATPTLFWVAHARAFFLVVDVLWIIGAAYLLYRVVDEAGAIRRISQALPHLTAERGLQALIIGWLFASFLEGVGGFGVPAAVTAPLLVELGLAPVLAVAVASVGHAWGVTFGSLGGAFQALIGASGQPAAALAPEAALMLGIACLLTGWLVTYAVGGWSALRRLGLPVLLLGAVMGTVQYLSVAAGVWNLGAFAGAAAGLALVFPLSRAIGQGGPRPGGEIDFRGLAVAVSGYAALIAIILAVNFIEPLHALLTRWVIQAQFPEVVTGLGYVNPAGPGRRLVVFSHTGTVLIYAALAAYTIYRMAGWYTPGAARRILTGAGKQVGKAGISIALMVSMAVILELAGMTDELARGMAAGVGALFPLVAPWIGALGAFMTGSNTNSNVVFAQLQLRTALLLGAPVETILAGQTAGASLASVIAPTKVVVAVSMVGLGGSEGRVIRAMAGYIAGLVLLVSLLTALLVGVQSWMP